MRDILVAVQINVTVEDDITMGEIRKFISDALEARMDADQVAADHGDPLPRIMYNGDIVGALAVRSV